MWTGGPARQFCLYRQPDGFDRTGLFDTAACAQPLGFPDADGFGKPAGNATSAIEAWPADFGKIEMKVGFVIEAGGAESTRHRSRPGIHGT
jgi:hypothetical protein